MTNRRTARTTSFARLATVLLPVVFGGALLLAPGTSGNGHEPDCPPPSAQLAPLADSGAAGGGSCV